MVYNNQQERLHLSVDGSPYYTYTWGFAGDATKKERIEEAKIDMAKLMLEFIEKGYTVVAKPVIYK